jgi:hypothetical protein
MKIVVIGGAGSSEKRFVNNLRRRPEVVAASPSSGVNTLTAKDWRKRCRRSGRRRRRKLAHVRRRRHPGYLQRSGAQPVRGEKPSPACDNTLRCR